MGDIKDMDTDINLFGNPRSFSLSFREMPRSFGENVVLNAPGPPEHYNTYDIIKIFSRDYKKSKSITDVDDTDHINKILKSETSNKIHKEINYGFIFRQLRYPSYEKRYYEYYILIQNVSNNAIWCIAPVSDYIIQKGIIINIQDINTKDQTYINTEEIPILTVNNNFLPGEGDNAWKGTNIIRPNPGLLNIFNTNILYEIKTATKMEFVKPDLKVDFDYTYDGVDYLESCRLDNYNKTSFIHIDDLLDVLREPENISNDHFTDIYKEFIDNTSEDKYSDAFFRFLLKQDIDVDAEYEGKMIDIPNTDGYVTGLNPLLQTTYSYTGHKFGKARNLINIQASAEIEYFGEYNIDNININYIVGDLQKYIDFSPTAKHYHPYKNEKDICVCYGSYIIPYGNLGRTKHTKKSRNTLLYRKFSNGLNIEIEHIAHFLQMLFFGGSKYKTWENLLGDLKKNQFVQDILKNLKDIRELLYDFSIAIFNQWKGHLNVYTFEVGLNHSQQAQIVVTYKENTMNEILCQTFLNKKFESNKNYTEWKGEERFEKFGRPRGRGTTTLDEYCILELVKNWDPVFYLKERNSLWTIEQLNPEITRKSSNGGTKTPKKPSKKKAPKKKAPKKKDVKIDVDKTNKKVEEVFENIREKTHSDMNVRKNKLNDMFNNCEGLLLVTLTIFRKMLVEYLKRNMLPEGTEFEHLDILKYKFEDRLKELIKENQGGGVSQLKKGGTLQDGDINSPEDLVKVFNNVYEQFNNNEMIDMLEHIFNVVIVIGSEIQPVNNDLSTIIKRPQEINPYKLSRISKRPSQEINSYKLSRISERPSQEISSMLSDRSFGSDVFTDPDKSSDILMTPRKSNGGNKKKRTPKKKSSKKKRTPKKKSTKKKRIPKKKKSIKKKPQKKSRKKSIKKSLKKKR